MTSQLHSFFEVLEDVSSGNPKVQQAEFLPEGDIAIVDQGQSLVGGYTNERSLLFRGEIPVIVFGDHTRVFKYVDFPFVLGADGVKVLRVRSGWDAKFVFHYLRWIGVPSAGYSRHFKFLKEVEFPRPPIAEQRRIAAALDAIETLMTRVESSLAELESLSESLLINMLADESQHEDRRTLRDLSSLITKGTTPTSVGLEFSAAGVPFLRVQNLAGGTVRHETGDLFVSTETHKKLSRSVVLPQDLLVSIAGTIGRSAIVPATAPEMNCNQAVAIVRLLDPKDGPWLRTWLATTDALGQVGRSAVTATIANLSLTQLGGLRVPSVSEATVDHFNARIDAVEAVRLRMATRQAMLAELLDSVRSRMFQVGA